MTINIVKPTAKLKIDGVEEPISGFEFNAPRGAMGASLSVTLADQEAQIDPDAKILFSIGVDTPSDESAVRLMKNGQIAGRRAQVQLNADSVNFSAVNTLADKWGLAPRHPSHSMTLIR